MIKINSKITGGKKFAKAVKEHEKLAKKQAEIQIAYRRDMAQAAENTEKDTNFLTDAIQSTKKQTGREIAKSANKNNGSPKLNNQALQRIADIIKNGIDNTLDNVQSNSNEVKIVDTFEEMRPTITKQVLVDEIEVITKPNA